MSSIGNKMSSTGNKMSSTGNRFNDLIEDIQMKIIGNIIVFPDTPVTFGSFFKMNNLDNDRFKGCTFTLTGDAKDPRSINTRTLEISHLGDLKFSSYRDNYPYLRDKDLNYYNFNLFDVEDRNKLGTKLDFVNTKFVNYQSIDKSYEGGRKTSYQIITKLEIKENEKVILTAQKNTSGGGKKYVKKELLGKLRCIYKINGSRKEYVKHKGILITVTDYKKLMMRK